MKEGVVYVVACAAPAALRIRTLIDKVHDRGFDACLICTPTAARWIEADVEALAELTGYPVRSTYKLPTEPDVLPPADAMLVAPLTFNTLNKWAAGISDTLALGLINEAIGKRIPIITVPYINDALAAHPAVAPNIGSLRAAGVTVLDGDRRHAAEAYLWDLLLDVLARA
ncbi:flavoprotein [Actinoallomurus sp. CA-142502]|uniref:flavoprotein n=1 Tax=Actinoallomurus sp. CA-142502 TaxID=3239885 RepID=UPI003D8EC460